MQKRTVMMSAAAVLSLSALLAGCSSSIGGSSAAAPRHAAIPNGGTIVQAIPTKFGANMIPLLDSSYYTAWIDSYQFDSLLQFDQKDNLIGDLVNKWWYSKDRTTIFFHINPKAKWSNGKPVTSADVKLGVDWLTSKTYVNTDQGSYEYLVQNILGASKPLPDGQTPSGFKVISPSEFSMTMASPDAAVLPSMWSGIQPLPVSVLGKIPMKDWKNSSVNKIFPVGSGPFIMTSVNEGQSVTMKANPYYLFGKPHIEYNIFKVISPDTVDGGLASGQVQVGEIHAKDYASVKKMPGLGVGIVPENGFSYLGWRLNNATYGKEFSNLKFRQAVEYAINRNAIVAAIDKGFGAPENGPLPPINHWYNKSLNGAYAYSPVKANALLNAAGFKIKNGWRTTPDGKPFTPTITYASGNSNDTILATFIQQFLQAVHINVKVNPPLDFNTIINDLNNDANGKQPIQGFLLAWSLSNDPDPRGLWRASDNLNTTSIDWTNTKDPAVKLNDQLIHLQHTAAAFDISYRQNILNRWQTLLSQQMPENFLTNDSRLVAYSTKLKGVVFSPYAYGYVAFPNRWYLSK